MNLVSSNSVMIVAVGVYETVYYVVANGALQWRGGLQPLELKKFV